MNARLAGILRRYRAGAVQALEDQGRPVPEDVQGVCALIETAQERVSALAYDVLLYAYQVEYYTAENAAESVAVAMAHLAGAALELALAVRVPEYEGRPLIGDQFAHDLARDGVIVGPEWLRFSEVAKDTSRGRNQLRGAAKGHEEVHGTQEKKQARRDEMQRAVDEEHMRNPYITLTQARKQAAKKLKKLGPGYSYSSMRRYTQQTW